MKKQDGCIININKSVEKLDNKCKDILPLHALTGCDSVSYTFEKGKITAINLLIKSNLSLEDMCVLGTSEAEIVCVETEFLVELYGGKSRSNLNSVRYELFSKKVNPPQIKSLPPTDQSAVNHIKRAHLQIILWCSADSVAPLDVDINNFGWQIAENKTVKSQYGSCKVSPPSLLEVICCSCRSDNPYSKKLRLPFIRTKLYILLQMR